MESSMRKCSGRWIDLPRYSGPLITVNTATRSEWMMVSLESNAASCPPCSLFIRPIECRHQTTLCLKKVPTFKLSVTLSKSNRFSKFLHCWKAYENCYNTYDTTHLALGTLIHYLEKLNIRIFCRYLADVVENANKYAFKQCNSCGNLLRFDKVTESFKVRTLLRHSVLI